MNSKPILFSAPMVRAILEGRKTQTRRILKPQPMDGGTLVGPVQIKQGKWGWHYKAPDCESRYYPAGVIEMSCPKCPFGIPGDQLWVREAWCPLNEDYKGAPRSLKLPEDGKGVVPSYRADHNDPRGDGEALEWRPSIFMPRWASRITLEITDIRVQRLQDISEEDAIAEGIERERACCCWKSYQEGGVDDCLSAVESFESLWESINGADSWAANPWVWVLSFKVIES